MRKLKLSKRPEIKPGFVNICPRDQIVVVRRPPEVIATCHTRPVAPYGEYQPSLSGARVARALFATNQPFDDTADARRGIIGCGLLRRPGDGI